MFSLSKLKHVLCCVTSHYHHGKHYSCCRRLNDPQQHQTGELHQGEAVDLPQRHVAQVDQIGLVLGRHAEQLDSVKELQRQQEKKRLIKKRKKKLERWRFIEKVQKV